MAKGVVVRIQPHVLERLKELGKEHCRTVSQTIEWLVKKYDEKIVMRLGLRRLLRKYLVVEEV